MNAAHSYALQSSSIFFAILKEVKRLKGLHCMQAQEVSSTELASGSRQLAAAVATEEYSCEFGSTKFYALCALGGVLSCGITHTAVTPLDLVKCRLQVTRFIFKLVGTGSKIMDPDPNRIRSLRISILFSKVTPVNS